MSGLKKTSLILLTLFVALCAYWAIGRNIMVKAMSNQITAMQSEGFKVTHQGISVGGFPLKFRMNLSEPNIASPRSLEKPWSIKANDWRMESLSVYPSKWHITHKGEARIDMRGPKGERWLFDARPFNIDATAKIGMNGQLKALSVSGTKLKAQAVIGTLPPLIAIDEAEFSAAPLTGDMQYNLTLNNLFLEQDALKNLQRIFGPRIEELSGSALAIGLTSLETDVVENWKKTGQLTSEDWRLSWGGTAFQGGFNLSLSENGLSGLIRIELDDVGALITRLQTADIFTKRQARNARLAAALLPVNQNSKQEITLTLRDGFLTLFGQRILEL
jgi:hypothetical protein